MIDVGMDAIAEALVEPGRHQHVANGPRDRGQAHDDAGGPELATVFEDRRAELASVQVVDVRNPGEYAIGSIPDAAPIPVGQLPGRLDELGPSMPTVVFCAGGYRSSVAASVLRANGFADVSDIIGGYEAWASTVQPA